MASLLRGLFERLTGIIVPDPKPKKESRKSRQKRRRKEESKSKVPSKRPVASADIVAHPAQVTATPATIALPGVVSLPTEAIMPAAALALATPQTFQPHYNDPNVQYTHGHPGYPWYPPQHFPSQYLQAGYFNHGYPLNTPHYLPHPMLAHETQLMPAAPGNQAIQVNAPVSTNESTLELDEIFWPNGHVRRECIESEHADGRWRFSKWAWGSNGGSGMTERCPCLGVIQCTNCARTIRPHTNTKSRNSQLDKICHSCKSTGSLNHVKCKAISIRTVETQDGERENLLVWTHSGHHLHNRPPGGRLSGYEKDSVDIQVLRNHDGTALQLRTGDQGPGSIPLAEINPKLAKPRAARYAVEQSKSRVGVNRASTGGLSLLQELADLPKALGENCLPSSSLSNPTYICFQTEFMQKILQESVEAWLEEDDDGPSTARHGLVSDGDHSFFRAGTLLATCTFSPMLNTWCPVLYTWVNSLDIGHHRPHFRQMFEQIQMFSGSEFDPKLLFNIMDFSAAQRSAHAEEFANVMVSRIPNFALLSSSAQAAERAEQFKTAQGFIRGCLVHFERSSLRVKHSTGLVPAERVEEFSGLIRTMTAETTDADTFLEATEQIRDGFPNVLSWLAWWLIPANASMIFPAARLMDSALIPQTPATSNPIESQHSLLHRATGTRQDLLPGLRGLFFHIKTFERCYTAIEDGHFDPEPPRKRTRRKKTYFEHPDDRAPDTVEALITRPAKKASLKKKLDNSKLAKSQNTVSLPEAESQRRRLQSYVWTDGNSCFYDCGLELWYRCLEEWPEVTRAEVLADIPDHTVLSRIMWSLRNRLRWAENIDSGNFFSGENIMSSCQKLVGAAILHKWKLIDNAGDYGQPAGWIFMATMDPDLPSRVHEHFGIKHTLYSCCENGHPVYNPRRLIQAASFKEDEIARSRKRTGSETGSISDMFLHLIPRNGRNTTPLHELPTTICKFDSGCGKVVEHILVQTSWPAMLIIGPNNYDGNPAGLEEDVEFRIGSEEIRYRLVGRILYNAASEHYTSQVLLDNQTYLYNDMLQGRLRNIGSSTKLQETHSEDLVVLTFYSRTSINKSSTRSISDIIHDYCFPEIGDLAQYIDRTPTPPQSLSQDHDETLTTAKITTIPILHWTLDCVGCGENASGTMDLDEIIVPTIACEVCKTWSHVECVRKDYGLPDDFEDPDGLGWDCPKCAHTLGPQWNDSNIGLCILFQTRSSSKYYPAEVLKREGETVYLQWYIGNTYENNDGHELLPNFTRPVEACLKGLYYAFDTWKEAVKQTGPIRIPLRLCEDAMDRGYKNKSLTVALQKAYRPILEIISGNRTHPLRNLFDEWMRPSHGKQKMTSKDQAARASEFNLKYPIPIFFGDDTLYHGMLHLMLDAGDHRLENSLVLGLAQSLFKLVILREYLHRSPSDDAQVFTLWRQGFILRQVTVGECAQEACRTRRWDDGGVMKADENLITVSIKVDPELSIPDDFPLATITSEYAWLNTPHLTGLSGPLPLDIFPDPKPPGDHMQTLTPGTSLVEYPLIEATEYKPKAAVGGPVRVTRSQTAKVTLKEGVKMLKRQISTEAELPVKKKGRKEGPSKHQIEVVG